MDNKETNTSPIFRKLPVKLTFAEALKQAIDGKKITRLSWETNDIYGCMVSDRLNLFTGGEYHPWTLVSGDITAEDWVLLPEPQAV